jgi:hypothetical protein
MRIVHYAILSTKANDLAKFLTPILYIITTITILWLVNFDRRKDVFSSDLLFIFWLLVTLSSIPNIMNYSITFPRQVSHSHKNFHTTNNYLCRSNPYQYG